MQTDPLADKITKALATAKQLQAHGRLDEARHACQLILQVDRANAGAMMRLGLIARQAGQPQQAAAHFAELLTQHPSDLLAVRLLSMAWREAGQPEKADALLDRVMPTVVPDPGLLFEKGRCRLDLGDLAGAADYLARVVALEPRHPEAHALLGIARRRNGDPAGALAAFTAAVDVNPDDVAALNGIGNHYLETEQFETAIQYYRRAIAARPKFTKAWKNLAYALSLTGDADGARAAFEHILAKHPDYPEVRMDFGLFLLSVGEYARGWREYEGRWAFDKFEETDWSLGLPRWDGEPLQGRRLLLWGEQGIGDHVLYGTMLPAVCARAAGMVTVAVEQRLVPLFARSLRPHGVTVVERGAAVAADLQCPFGSMGQWLDTGPAERGDGAYLIADPQRSAALREAYAALGKPGDRLLGLSWRSANWHIGAYKSLDLETLLPVLRRPGVVWVNLQYGEIAGEIAAFAARHGIVIHQDPTIDAMRDLDGLAAQIAAMDGIVSTSNSTVHFAGALGRPCLVLLPFGRGRMWYWPRQGERTPWYGSLRLIRQTQAGDWAPVLRQVGEAIDAGF